MLAGLSLGAYHGAVFVYKRCASKYKICCNSLHNTGESLGVSLKLPFYPRTYRSTSIHFGDICETSYRRATVAKTDGRGSPSRREFDASTGAIGPGSTKCHSIV